MTDHSPLPWESVIDDDTGQFRIASLTGRNLVAVVGNAEYDIERDEQDARLIVTAVNTHHELVEALKMLITSVEDLVAESDGVAGLHKNGDLATWEELLPGGRFEQWLLAINDARAALAKVENANGN